MSTSDLNLPDLSRNEPGTSVTTPRQADPAPRRLSGRDGALAHHRRVGEAIDNYVNSRHVARGEVVVVDDRLGVTMTEIIKNSDA